MLRRRFIFRWAAVTLAGLLVVLSCSLLEDATAGVPRVRCRREPPTGDERCTAGGGESCAGETRQPLPSRVTLNQIPLRPLRRLVADPFARESGDTPRLLALHRLAASGRRPLFPDWRRRAPRASDGGPFPGSPDPFRNLTIPLGEPVPLFPVWTAGAEHWGPIQDSLLALMGCPCPPEISSPGQVPNDDDVAGIPLEVVKNASLPTDLDLSWDPSCLDTADDYAVYEGTGGIWYDHTPYTCSTGGALGYTLTPGTNDRYYLVVPLNPGAEGSYGTNSSGDQRPASGAPCRSYQVVEPCP